MLKINQIYRRKKIPGVLNFKRRIGQPHIYDFEIPGPAKTPWKRLIITGYIKFPLGYP